MFFSVAAASTVLLPLRYAQVSGLGFGSGDCSAAEGLRLRRFLCILWFLGEKVKLWLGAAVGSLGLDLDRFYLRSGLFLLLVRRRFGLTLLGAGSPFLARVCVGGSLYHDNVPCALSS
ncbi:hypothetical protein Bca52824_048081 [Brassica carinata]|uniref:Uncharacterized protein n=1 Tax=Brassica carinata TaxID=52824 RepID=A0A8X7RIG0_BRACI|nr:hypothetical protein Bca52824_048081 [Brassica carinata]